MTDEQLSALLRLKRHESPPPGYFDRLLTDVHRRQRTELLQRPLWKIAFERFQTFFGEHSMGPFSYAGAVASAVAVVALGVGVVNWMPGQMNQLSPVGELAAESTPAPAHRDLTLSLTPPPVPFGAQMQRFPSGGKYAEAATKVRPRYVIDARPVSYERPSSF